MQGEEGAHTAAHELAGLAGVASGGTRETVERALGVAREVLGMEAAYVAEVVGDRLEYRALGGDAGSFGLREGGFVPLWRSFCKRVIDGRLPNVVPDAKGDERVADLEVTRQADIGSYVGFPVRFSDGRVYGTLCAVSHSPDPSLKRRDAQFMSVLARLIAEQLEREELESEKRRLGIRAAGVRALLAALEARDGYTGEHSKAVVELSVAVARRLGLPEDGVTEVEQAALLHDVGKIGVPDLVLTKPGPLDEREWGLMRGHPAIGGRILASVEGLAHLAPIVRAGHERWDGKGYPDGLAGGNIPAASRIVFCCDSYHAMTSDRPYRRAIGARRALEELEENAGAQFDPDVVAAVLDVVGPARLPNGRP